MRLHIATLGLYANERITHVVMKRGADRVIIFYTEKNKAQISDIREQFEGFRIPVESIFVKAWSYNDILVAMLDVVKRHEGWEIEFNGSCGTRSMTAATYAAAILTDSPVYLVTESDESVIDELIEVKPVSVTVLTSLKRRILEKIESLGGSVSSNKELGTKTDLGLSSVSKHLRALARAGYVEQSRVGGKKVTRITELGRAVLRIKQIGRQRRWGFESKT